MSDDQTSLAAAVAQIAALRQELVDVKQMASDTAAQLVLVMNERESLKNTIVTLQGTKAELDALKAIYQAPLPTSGTIDHVMRYRTSDNRLHETVSDAQNHEALLILTGKGLSMDVAKTLMSSREKLMDLLK